MAKIVENGQFTSVVVEHNGSQFRIWRFDRAQREYEVFCNKKGGLSVTFSDIDAVELAAVRGIYSKLPARACCRTG